MARTGWGAMGYEITTGSNDATKIISISGSIDPKIRDGINHCSYLKIFDKTIPVNA